MPRTGKSVYIESEGHNDQSIVKGFEWLIQEAKEQGTKGLIAVLTKQELSGIAEWCSLGHVLKELVKNDGASHEQISLKLFTAKSKVPSSWNGPVLAIHGGQDLLNAVDSLNGKSDVLYIPLSEDDYEDWIVTWNASNLHDQPAENVVEEEPTSGIAFTALSDLAKSASLSTGVGHDFDRERVVKALETLYRKQVNVSSEAIRQQLIRLNWNPSHAEDVKKIAESIWQGNRPKGSTGQADEALWQAWEIKEE